MSESKSNPQREKSWTVMDAHDLYDDPAGNN